MRVLASCVKLLLKITCIPVQSKWPTFCEHLGQSNVPDIFPCEICVIHDMASVKTDEHLILGFLSCLFLNFLAFWCSSWGKIELVRNKDTRHFLHFQHKESRWLKNIFRIWVGKRMRFIIMTNLKNNLTDSDDVFQGVMFTSRNEKNRPYKFGRKSQMVVVSRLSEVKFGD